MKRVYIFDTTLRDGGETPGVRLNVQEKLELAKQLALLGVDCIEAGFPSASKSDFEGVKAIAQNVKNTTIVGIARAEKQDIDRAYEALKYAEKPRIHIYIATSDIHMEYKLKKKPEEVLKTAVEMVAYAKTLCNDVEFSPEDASRTKPEFLYKVLEGVIEAGATVVNIPDTVGYSTPREFGEFIKGIKENVPNIDKAIIGVHCHNDLGMAVANSLAAVENGAEQIECAVNGLGERAGNAALEEVVMAIATRKDSYDAYTNIDTKQIYRTSFLVNRITGIQIQPNKAIVGANAFVHESGIHQQGVLNKRETYEIMTPQSIGLNYNHLILSDTTEKSIFEDRLKELGYNLSEEKVNEVYEKFKTLADKKKYVMDKDIEALVNSKVLQVPEVFELEYFHITSGNTLICTATVKIRHEDEVIEEAACGDGAMEAVFKAIDRATKIDVKLVDYYLKAITSEKNALGEVTIKIKKNGNGYSGHGVSTDIIEASARAYVNALNMMMSDME